MHYLSLKMYSKELKVGKIKDKYSYKYELSTPPYQNFAIPRAKNNAYTHSAHQVDSD